MGSSQIAPRMEPKRIARVVVVVVTVVVVLFVARLLVAPLPPSRSVGWRLADGFLGTPKFDPTTAQTTTVVPISVDWLACAPRDDSWLLPPEIRYAPTSVTITVHTTDAFAATTTCGGGNEARSEVGIMLDVGIPVEVLLSEPLGGRALFDGGPPLPDPRPYR